MSFHKSSEAANLLPLLQHLQGASAPAPQGRVGEPRVAPKAVESPATGTEQYTAVERQFLLALARQALLSAVTAAGALPEIALEAVAPRLAEQRACFVTLTKSGKLRGCVGQVLPRAPLYQAITTTTRSAALCDPRFSPVAAAEIAALRIEVSILTEPQPLSFTSPEDLLRRLRPHEHGVVLSLGERLATFLPQVWEHLPDKIEFLNRLAQKAGGRADAWRTEEASVRVYQVEVFQEE